MQNFTVYDRNHKYRKVIGVIGEKCLQLFGHQNNIHHTISLSLSGRTVLEVKAFVSPPFWNNGKTLSYPLIEFHH